MPIVECGFPTPPAPTTPQDALVLLGPTVLVDIGFDPQLFDPSLAPAVVGLAAVPARQGVPALVDTGASQSLVDEQLAQELQLPLVNQQPVAGVGGGHVLNVYLAHLVIPALGTVQHGLFSGARLSDGGAPHRALIGRTLLRDMMLIYDGLSGSVRLVR